MNKLSIVLICIFPGWIFANDILEKVRENTAKIKNYQFQCEVKMGHGKEAMCRSSIYGQTPNLLKMEIKFIRRNGSQVCNTLFDGTWQWIEMTNYEGEYSLGTSVSKIKLNNSNKPFASGYNISGHGLFIDEDYISTVNVLLDIYNFKKAGEKVIDGQKCTVFKGSLNDQAFYKYAAGDRDSADMLKPMLKSATIYVSNQSYLVMGHDFSHFFARFSQLQINSSLPQNTFAYEPPKGKKVYDITSYIRLKEEENNLRLKKRKEIKQKRDQEVKDAIAQMIILLEKGQVKEFLENYFDPRIVADLKSRGDFSKAIEDKKIVKELLTQLRKIAKMEPSFDKDYFSKKDIATYPDPEREEIRFKKINKRWYLTR